MTMPMKIVPMNAGDEKQHQRFGQRHGGLQLAVEVAFGDVGDAHQFLVQPAAFFGDGDHFQDRAGEEAAAVRQAWPKRLAFLDPFDRVGHGIDEDLVADRSAGDVQRR